MFKMDAIQRRLLAEVANLHEVPAGAYNFRANGELAGRNNTANIEIVSKDKSVEFVSRLSALKHIDEMTNINFVLCVIVFLLFCIMISIKLMIFVL